MENRRNNLTQKLVIHANKRHSVYICTSHDSQGRIQEAFISVEKTGADERAYVDVASRYLSRELQRGVPLDEALEPFDIKTAMIGAISGYPGLGFCRGYLDAARKYLLAYQGELYANQEQGQQELQGR